MSASGRRVSIGSPLTRRTEKPRPGPGRLRPKRRKVGAPTVTSLTRPVTSLTTPVTSLTLVRRIAARPSIVFDALSTPEGISCWWGPDDGPVLIAETDVRVGGHFRVRFRKLDGSEHESSGQYLEVRKPERLVMTWRWLGGEEDPGESRVEVDLRPIPEGTELTFTHSQLSSEATRLSHEQGWTGALDKLVRQFPKLTG